MNGAGIGGVDLGSVWQDYGLDELQRGMNELFPEFRISLSDLMAKALEGDIIGAMAGLLGESINGMAASAGGLKNIFAWLLALGIASALMSHFVEVFDKKQVADLSFYFMYLLMAAILLKCFTHMAAIAVDAIENILLFIKLLIPTYLLAVGMATGSVTVSAYYQLLLLIIYGVENILLGLILPLVSCYCLTAVINGIWIEEKLTLFIEFLEKLTGWILKASLGVVTGVSVFQAVVTPILDSVKSNALQKAISAIPGVGGAADGVVELAVGSAVVIKNSVGVALLLLLLLLCAAPLMKIFAVSVLLKGAAAFMGVVSDKRITSCANRAGEAGMLLFRTVGTAMLLFLITIAIVATTTNRGF